MDGNIWTMNVDGSARTQLTSGPEPDEYPAWSPDGTKILFTRHLEWDPDCGCWRQPHLYVMNADGTNVQQVTTRPGMNSGDWSPDGTRIVYTGGLEVYIANADGTNEQQVNFGTPGYTFGGYVRPVWTSDGEEIAIAAATARSTASEPSSS